MIRVLGIAPYENMKFLMLRLAEEYPQIEFSVFVGDLEEGLEIARQNFHGNYDVVISRGGTAQMLQKHIPLPVVEVEISMYDILCTLKLADNISGKIALVSFSNTAENSRMLCELIGYQVDIFTVESVAAVEPTLRKLRDENYQTILCDVIANNTAKRLGLNSFLITSGVASIRKAFEQAMNICNSQQHLREENLFFRGLVQGQIGHTVVFDDSGHIYFSTLEEQAPPALLELLRRELPESLKVPERRVTRNLNGQLYYFRSRKVIFEERFFVAFFFTKRKIPLTSGQLGIQYLSAQEAESAFYSSIFSFAGNFGDFREKIDQINKTSSPVMITGEDGTGKESIASMIYMWSQLRNNPLITVNCSLLNEKSWEFLLEHIGSPLTEESCTLYFSNIDVLTPERQKQLLAALTEMDVCKRSRVIFSCVCQPGEYTSPAGSLFLEKLYCIPLYLPPLRTMADRIPNLVNMSISHFNINLDKQIIGVEPEAMDLLQQFQWPHNYTQLRRVMGELTTAATEQLITLEHVRQVLRNERHGSFFAFRAEDAVQPLNLDRSLREIEHDIAIRVLEESNGNQTIAARRLGISRTTIWRILQREA